jgi:hypothetical protein
MVVWAGDGDFSWAGRAMPFSRSFLPWCSLISRESLFKALSGERIPGFDTIYKLFRLWGLNCMQKFDKFLFLNY